MASANLEAVAREFYVHLKVALDGDASPMLAFWSHAPDVSYMGPFGEFLVGWEPIRASWEAQAARHLGGTVEPADLHFYESATLGVAIGYERGSNLIDGETVPVNIRATSVYRREDGRWMMIGHHTDRLG